MAIYDPSTNTYVDPASGVVSSDPYGQIAVNNPSLVNQARRNLAVSSGLLSQLSTYGQKFNQAVSGEQTLARNLNDVIAGRAPSVAQVQLEQGLDQIRQQQESEASGATGTNAALARMNAQRFTGDAAAKANQDAALLRATEIANAERNEGAVLGNIAGQTAGMYGNNLQGASTFSGQAGNEAAEQAKIDEARDEANKRLITNLLAAGGATAATLASGGVAGPAASAAAQGIAAGQAGNAAANSAGPSDITANLPAPVANTSVTNEDLLATPSTAPAPSASETHALVNSLSPTYEGPDINRDTGYSTSQAYTSDRREKIDVHKAPMDDLLDKIAGFTFDYKHPGTNGEPAGKRVGVMAQDLDKSALGRTAVIPGTPMKVDAGNLAGLALAAVAHLNNELKKLKK